MSDATTPGFSPARAMLILADHDGDDRTGYLSGAIQDFVLAREDASTAAEFVARFDEIMERMLDQFRADMGL